LQPEISEIEAQLNIETFEKCSILFKFKAGEIFNHPDEIGTGIHTLSILRIKI